jgi:linear primary-alkylsulfatase
MFKPTPSSRWATRSRDRSGAASSLRLPRELRAGIIPAHFSTVAQDMVLGMPIDILFHYAAVQVIGDKAADADIRIDFTFTDLDETWSAHIHNGVLNARQESDPDATLTVSGPKPALVAAILQPAAAAKLAEIRHLTRHRKSPESGDRRSP